MATLREAVRRSQHAVTHVLAALTVACVAGCPAGAQSLKVTPVNILMLPGQKATSLTVTNDGASDTAIQIRVYAWTQQDGDDRITPSDEVLLSPPLATIAANSSQVVRLVVRRPPQGREGSYRILLDQIPTPSTTPGVKIVLRMSIPIFVRPKTPATPHLRFHLERDATHLYLVAINDGLCHDIVRDLVLSTLDGRTLKTATSGLPYLLAGSRRRWAVLTQDPLPGPSETLRVKARTDSGAIERQVRVVEAR